MKPVRMKEGLFWVGALDWGTRDFHGYVIPHGTSYNNYLILDEEVTLIDAVKQDFVSTSLANIASLTDPANIRHIVINHIENDHVSGIGEIKRHAPEASVYITEKGKKGLARFFDLDSWDVRIVKTGDTLNIGTRTLMFLETPMLHWPDSMMTYIKEDKVLISQDAFGIHYASSERFDDDLLKRISETELEDAVKDYYANILMPFGTLIKTKIGELQKLGLDIEMIAPDHGIIWRKDPSKIVNMYLDMANGKADLGVAIIYDTMWNSTAKMTEPISDGIRDEGVEVKVIKLRSDPFSVAVKEFWKMRGCLIGSPTLNNSIFPTVAGFLAYLKGLRPKNRIAGTFGSFGWAGGAVRDMNEEIRKMGLDLAENSIEVLYKPSADDMARCYEFGKDFGRKTREYHSKFQ
jgi:anaerobic nitric oxide reductase flavorubredoxin